MEAVLYKTRDVNALKRQEQIASRVGEALKNNRTRQESKFRGGRDHLALITVSIHDLLYRLANYRTRNAQFSKVAAGKVAEGFFEESHQEAQEVQTIQHEILVSFAREGSGETIKPIYDELERVQRQTEDLIISMDGVVVNGNRRLAAMRELWETKRPEFSSFEHVSCAVLPASTTAEEVLALEIELQMQPDTKLPYDWTVIGLAARDLLNLKYAPGHIARLMNRDEEEVKRAVKMIDCADMYLQEWLNLPRGYDNLDRTEQAFRQIATRNVGVPDKTDIREITRKFDFFLVEKRNVIDTRAYELINNIEGSPDLFLSTLAGEWALDLSKRKAEPKPQLKIDFSDVDDESTAPDFSVLVDHLESIRGNREKENEAAAVVEQVSLIVGEQGKKKELAALKFAKAAHAKLAAINVRTASEATYAELQSTLNACIELCEKHIAGIGAIGRSQKG